MTQPDALPPELVDAALADAQARLSRFAEQPQTGYAFQGRLQVEVGGEMEQSNDVLGLLTRAGDLHRIVFADRDDGPLLTLRYGESIIDDRITTDDWGVVCPSDLPVPRPGEPFLVDQTLCTAMERGLDTSFSIDVEPVEPDDLVWDDLLFLNTLQVYGWTPHNDLFEQDGDAFVVLDQASYKEGSGVHRTYVDYEARWQIDPNCLSSYGLTTIDILHAERCDISGHTHGRYDSSCSTIATVDGRPSWARYF